ncbi:MAG: PEGA domain-containing protein [Candidatus Doudnabacteria bacterium]|nr:PEGA domain-containing protein [Candidatus Doudnabacteria bacterium]
MKLRNRFGLVGLGIVIFLIVTPALVLYARGFKIDWKDKTFVKTGALVVRTEPSKADIFINDEKHKSDTPANIRFLIPADYNIRVEKNGYQSWTKRLSIKSQLVTWANLNREFVTLFFNNPGLTKTTETKAVTISSNNKEIIYLTPDHIAKIDVDGGDYSNLLKINNPNLSLLTSNTEIKWQNSSAVINSLANKANRDVLESMATKINHLEIDNNNIVLKVGNDLYILKSGNLISIDKTINDFTLASDDVWYIKETLLKHYNISTNKFETINSELPLSKTSEIIRTPDQIYLILDSTLYLFNGNLETIYSPVLSGQWDESSSSLVYTNNHEVYLYQPSSKDSMLIVRSLTPIQSPIVNNHTGYVFYQNENKIKAIEIDGRDHRNIFTIADALSDFTLSQDGKKLFTIGSSEIKQYKIRD